MRILSLLVVLLAVSVGAPPVAWAQTWATYTSEAGRFRVDMPGKPEESQQTSPKAPSQSDPASTPVGPASPASGTVAAKLDARAATTTQAPVRNDAGAAKATAGGQQVAPTAVIPRHPAWGCRDTRCA